jgi:hypothetical protein
MKETRTAFVLFSIILVVNFAKSQNDSNQGIFFAKKTL